MGCCQFGFVVWDWDGFADYACCTTFAHDDVAHGYGFQTVFFDKGSAQDLSANKKVGVNRVQQGHKPHSVSVAAYPRYIIGKQNCGNFNCFLDSLKNVIKVCLGNKG